MTISYQHFLGYKRSPNEIENERDENKGTKEKRAHYYYLIHGVF